MNIVMITNTYTPHVGGVARSVVSFSHALRERGHQVLVVAPTFDQMPKDEMNVIRLSALQNFNGSDFSVRLPLPGFIGDRIEGFEPNVVHTHHPFLMGDTALRIARYVQVPLVFTHHTMYERYTHYVPGDSPAMQEFAIRLATEYANLCDHVIAPSQSIAKILRERGVMPPITSLPTGIDAERFCSPDNGDAFRWCHNIDADAFVVGHVGRLAPEKNLPLLARVLARFTRSRQDVRVLIVGEGPSRPQVERVFRKAGIADQLLMTGTLTGDDLVDAYHAMDVFAFASQSETQGVVLAEAMTAGVPVVAVDSPGVREIVHDGINGYLLPEEDAVGMVEALMSVADAAADDRASMRRAAQKTSVSFSLEHCTDRLLDVYADAVNARDNRSDIGDDRWSRLLDQIAAEWQLWFGRAKAAADSIGPKS